MEYSRADAVAKTIKEVYRDLLSSKDKDFAGAKRDEQETDSQTNYFYPLSDVGEDDKDKQTKVKASFEGALSLGVDEISNTVIVSAQEEWMASIARMIEYLDENARPTTTVSVLPIGSYTNAAAIKEALLGLGVARVGNQPPKKSEESPDRKSPQKAVEGQPTQSAGSSTN